MIKFFQIGTAKLRPTIQALRRAAKPAPAHKPRLPAVRADTTTQPEPETIPPEPAMNAAETSIPRYFSPISLSTAEPVDSGTIERHALVFGDAELRALAMRCTAALDRLTGAAAFANFLSLAAEASHAHGGTPAEWLKRTLLVIEEEVVTTKIEHGRHNVRERARFARLMPLRQAADNRLTAARREIDALRESVQSAEKYPFGNQAVNPYQKLIDAGLTPKQIALVGTEDPVSKIAQDAEKAKVRITELQVEIPALQAFFQDTTYSPAHLQGLDGFDVLIADSLNVVEEQAA